MNKLLSITALSLTLFSGCIDEDIYPCPKNGMELQYNYLLNMEYKDLLTSQVGELKTFVFNEDGVLDTVFVSTVANDLDGSAIRKVEIDPGIYQILTWAGNENYERTFTFNHYDPLENSTTDGFVIGQTKLADLQLFLRCKSGIGGSDQIVPETNHFDDLFYGQMQQVEVKPKEFTTATTSLIKDSKTIRVKVKKLSAIHVPAPVETDFSFLLTGYNGQYNTENKTEEDSRLITYTPFSTLMDKDTIQADIKTLRLIKQEATVPLEKRLLLTVTCAGNVTVCKDLDVVNLILNSKIPSRDPEGNVRKDDKGEIVWVYPTLEYLDRQDLFEITFVREVVPPSGGGDLGFTIYVNGWKIMNIIPDV